MAGEFVEACNVSNLGKVYLTEKACALCILPAPSEDELLLRTRGVDGDSPKFRKSTKSRCHGK